MKCKTCKFFPENKEYAFCSNAHHSGRLEVMASFPACGKYKKGKYIPFFAKNFKVNEKKQEADIGKDN